jgi:hypothetical protein
MRGGFSGDEDFFERRKFEQNEFNMIGQDSNQGASFLTG